MKRHQRLFLISFVALALLGSRSVFSQDDDFFEGDEPEFMEPEFIEDDFEVPEPPPPSMGDEPPPRFIPPPTRGGAPIRNSGRLNRAGGSGVDRLGRTEGAVEFRLVEPPRYWKKKNRPDLPKPKGISKE